MSFKFSNYYAELGDGFYTAVEPNPLPEPKGVIFNRVALMEAGFGDLSDEELTAFFSGNTYPKGAKPLAMKYAGHQFGHYNPDLGDGRGLLMGQINNQDGELIDLHLKGAGKTPYSRMGDGRAVLRSSLREFLASEALFHLGIPTTRGLGITTSDELVRRETYESATMLMRMSDTHIRFGSFEHFFYTNQHDKLKMLCDYTIEHHFPEAQEGENPIEEMMFLVADKTAALIAKWQVFGFSHGVLNTDNMSITGQTFDFGPYGFMEQYDPYYICNHSDDQGRYAYNKQPAIGFWNLQAFMQSLNPFISTAAHKVALEIYENRFMKDYHSLMAKKIGLPELTVTDKALYQDLLDLMEGYKVDYTNLFRGLSHYRHNEPPESIDVLSECADAFIPWFKKYNNHIDPSNEQDRHKHMCATNPKYILRNYLAQLAIQDAEQGDYAELHKLYEILKKPYDEQSEFEEYAKVSPAWGQNMQLSCSS